VRCHFAQGTYNRVLVTQECERHGGTDHRTCGFYVWL